MIFSLFLARSIECHVYFDIHMNKFKYQYGHEIISAFVLVGNVLRYFMFSIHNQDEIEPTHKIFVQRVWFVLECHNYRLLFRCFKVMYELYNFCLIFHLLQTFQEQRTSVENSLIDRWPPWWKISTIMDLNILLVLTGMAVFNLLLNMFAGHISWTQIVHEKQSKL